MRPSCYRPAIVPGLGSFFCSGERIAEWQVILHEHQALIPGFERSLDQATETNHLCEALRAHSETDLVRYLRAR